MKARSPVARLLFDPQYARLPWGGKMPPFHWTAPLSPANVWAFQSRHPALFDYLHTQYPHIEDWDEMIEVVRALLFRQIPLDVIPKIAALSVKEQSAVIALLPPLWTLHAEGTRPEHDLWTRLGSLRSGARDETGVVLRALVDEAPARRPTVARFYAIEALSNTPKQMRFGDLPPPGAVELLHEARRLATGV